MFPKSNDKSETQSSQAALNDAWRKVTERCKFSLAGGVSELSGLIWYMIAITISVHISRAGGPTQGRRQPQRRWKKVHLASVITDVFVYLHSFLRRPANGRDYILTCFSLQLAQNLESAPTYPALGLQWRPWLRPIHIYRSPTLSFLNVSTFAEVYLFSLVCTSHSSEM